MLRSSIPLVCVLWIIWPAHGSQSSFSSDQVPFWAHEGLDQMAAQFPTDPFNGMNTFALIPYENCFLNESSPANRYDIAILGAPHDTTVTGRPGARYGPSSIRTASNLKTWGPSVFHGRDLLHDWAKIVDCGDAPLPWLDNRVAIQFLDHAHKLVSQRATSDQGKGKTPRIMMLGGDHTTTLSALRSVKHHWGKVSVIHFDSHIDTWDPKVLGGGISDYAGLNHGTFLHIAHEENLILNSSVHAGIRAPVSRIKKDIRNDRRCGFEIINSREIDKVGITGVIQKIRERVGNTKVYITVDIDVLDPAFAPATGTPEPGGWSTRELVTILSGLEGLEVVGGDVVEVAPAYDSSGVITGLAAAEVATSLMELMVATPILPENVEAATIEDL